MQAQALAVANPMISITVRSAAPEGARE